LQRGGDPLGDADRLAGVAQVLEQHGELVAAEAGDGVGRADAGAEPAGDGDEELVADLVAEAVVDDLEPVEVEEEDADGRRRLAGAGQGVVEAVGEEGAIGEGRSGRRGTPGGPTDLPASCAR